MICSPNVTFVTGIHFRANFAGVGIGKCFKIAQCANNPEMKKGNFSKGTFL